jgi:hypothetical protein
MSRYTRGPVIPDLATLIFCLQANDHIYHVSHLLPSEQYWSWSLDKLRLKVREGKLFKAELKC